MSSFILEVVVRNFQVHNRAQARVVCPIESSGVTRGGAMGRTAPGDTLQGVTPKEKNFCGQIYKE